jgi:CRP-like cAMP-binding protein
MAPVQEALLAQLKAAPLFQAVASRDLSALAERANRRRLGAGVVVFQEGSPADSLYIVLSGSVKIFVNDAGKEVVLDTKKAGDYFGEMMLDHRPRSASIMTLEPAEFAVIGREDFRSFLSQHPQAAEKVILGLIHVTRGMNERVKDYVARLDNVKAADLPSVKRWSLAKRWVLAGLLILAVVQFYFMDVFLQIVSLPSVTLFPPR